MDKSYTLAWRQFEAGRDYKRRASGSMTRSAATKDTTAATNGTAHLFPTFPARFST